MAKTTTTGTSKLPVGVSERSVAKVDIRDGGEVTASRLCWCTPAGFDALVALATPTDIVIGSSLIRSPRLHWPRFPWLRLESISTETPDPDFIASKQDLGAAGTIATTNDSHGFFATLTYSTKRHDTFIISADSGAEFLKLPPGFHKSQPEQPVSAGTIPSSRAPTNVQIHKVIPLTHFTFRWLGVPNPNWLALDSLKGCVNDVAFSGFGTDADGKQYEIGVEELLYSSYSFQERITPKNELQYDLTIKMILRRIPYDIAGTPYYAGWNHVFRSDRLALNAAIVGAHGTCPWHRLEQRLYQRGSLKALFKQAPDLDLRKGFLTNFGLASTEAAGVGL